MIQWQLRTLIYYFQHCLHAQIISIYSVSSIFVVHSNSSFCLKCVPSQAWNKRIAYNKVTQSITVGERGVLLPAFTLILRLHIGLSCLDLEKLGISTYTPEFIINWTFICMIKSISGIISVHFYISHNNQYDVPCDTEDIDSKCTRNYM